ncbi:zinc-dependent alcohol dehydrogenase family protein [Selenomonas felix]|uniref:zinc-dependent alcohol dehydrogenase family protein n=1 Tax=Selenomonas felix TaxID=1944634 RepID=UPI00235478F5|nr:zinc-dependent alcohol dehydrogenase family protein [Selenomonas felix]
MKALVLTGKHEVHLGSFPEPPLAANAVKIAVAYCGLCGTDLHKYEGKSGSRPLCLPVPLGHEISGVVEAVGEQVKDFRPGDRVTADPNWSCGHCFFCQDGRSSMCENSRGVVKGMADYICPPQENVYKLPDGLSLRDAALTEPLSCCLHGMDLLDVKLGETAAIIGMGAIGTIMVQLVKLAGAAEIIVIETVEEKREKALALGATHFINPRKEDPVAAIAARGIRNVGKVMECVGLPTTVNTALAVAGKGARVVLFGLGDPDQPVLVDTYTAVTKELDIQTSFLNPYTTARAIHLLAGGSIDVGAVISKEMGAEELVRELAERTYSRQGKVMVKWKDLE